MSPAKSTAASTTKAKKAAAASATELPPEIFDAKVNVALIHQVVVAQEAAARQGTHATKTRGDVRGGGKKPYRQKGTGRARQGSLRAPQYAGGGTVHGPQPRSYEQRTPKKMKAAALRGALSDRARHGRVHVVDSLVDSETPSTKLAMSALAELTGAASAQVLMVIADADALTRLSLRNVPTVHLLPASQLNTRDVLVSDHVVFTTEALDSFVARTLGDRNGVAGATVVSEPVREGADAAATEPAAASPAKPAAARRRAPAKDADTTAPAEDADTTATAQATAQGAGRPAPAQGAGAPAPAQGAGAPAPAQGAGAPAPAQEDEQ
jgi:large subunit ribosomal protein L4